MDEPEPLGCELIELCTTCGAPTRGIVTEKIDGDRLVWAVSFRCAGCGGALEVDDEGEMPEKVRAALVAQVGLVRLLLDADAARGLRVALLAVFRKRGMAYSEAAAAYTAIIDIGIVGTPAEMQLLADQVTRIGVAVSLEPAGSSIERGNSRHGR